jgi:uncharacterized protein YkwD
MKGLAGRTTRARRPSRHFCLTVLCLVAGLATVLAVAFATVGLAATGEPVARQVAGASDSGKPATAAVQTTIAPPTTLAPPSTTVTTAAPAPAGPGVEYSAEELEFVRLLNEYRVSNGLEPLLLSDTLTVACERHTSDMVTYDFLNHLTGYYRASGGGDVALKGTRSDYFDTGADPGERMEACGYDYRTVKGENLAAGQPTAAEALQTLKDSPTHNANLLHPDFKVIGIAAVHASDSEWGHYWTTDFGGFVDASAHAPATVVASAD